ncbi:MAG: hypothetical protein ACXAC5_13545 [Promethearchaeota archaeon]|jgi:chromosome segregation protein
MSEDNLTEKINDLNDEIYTLKSHITTLETELNIKETEIYKHLETIEHLEDVLMKMESLLPDEKEEKKSKKQKAVESKLVLELEQKEKQFRDLKNRMGFLRKEKGQIQQELERIKSETRESNVIRTENLRSKPPLEILVKDLQDKVNKQKSIIEILRRESIDVSEFDTKVKEKEEAIERKMANFLQTQIDDQTKTIRLKNEEIEELKMEVDNTKSKLDVLEVQIKMKDQKIEELNKKSRKRKN